MTSPLISTADLSARLGEPGLSLIDASWHLDGRDGRPDFEAARLPGAIFFDLEASSDPDSPLPHMLPAPDVFAARMGALGVAADDSIVVYDTAGIRSSARAWWMFRAMGARDVRVLDGGLPKWLAEDRPVESGPVTPPAAATFLASARPGLVADRDAVRAALLGGEQVLDGGLPKWRAEGRPIESGPPSPPTPAAFAAHLDHAAVADLDAVRAALAGAAQVIDARAADRFEGRAPEPRAGLRSGHMPGALNLPFPGLLNPDGAMKSAAELEAAFRAAGLDLDRLVVTSCGSGVTAAILSLGLAVLGRPSRLYDGSWAEWGGRDDTEIVSG
ncbi:MAG: rhodanese-like domain-containing protein [Brevundimonas sp.]|uniref:sulfurtransferase n=1 Tax=Brevundimonas sp. TaxID=1871086 RepID=UPI002AB90BB7|nr:rhodanese-like domain-containing protein [Brevundimonas sp.]MDZ4111116.1 rhodanese-like domain-containing protein [Brevundimonas sp.]